MNLRPLMLATALGLGLSAHAADWQADASASTLNFSATAEGQAFTGTFKEFSPAIRFDPADLSSARFEVKIALASADSENAERDETLQGSDFFATRTFPQASYTATTFRDLGNGKFTADGTLTLRGVEKPVTLEFSWTQDGNHATLDGRTTLNRLDFDVGGGDWADASTIAHEVSVTTTLKLSAE
ncbi:YceI family protein [Xanthomonadaceae bacterium JHOS43]|nr:YceI family protein [Xanthomonadaceae bacterium JHOS43]MCX7564149.1 YceI family protein [Xanthomonadaceae bacterium XH05]